MDDKVEKGLRAWLRWSGRQDTPAAMLDWRKRLAADTSLLESLGERLYASPDENDRGAIGREPEADFLYQKLSRTAGVSTQPFWPLHAPYAICVTHDIDRIFATYQRMRGFFGRPIQTVRHVAQDFLTWARSDLHSENPFHNFKSVIDIERSWGISSAAYVLFEHPRFWRALSRGEIQHLLGAYDALKIMPDLRTYEAAGNEVGVHGSFDSWNDEILLGQERREIQKHGMPLPSGVRNHYLQYDLNTPLRQSKAGFQYDSTMGFNFRSGFRCGTSFPFTRGDLLEIPLIMMDTGLRFSYPSFLERRDAISQTMNTVRRQQGVLMVDWHLHHMNQKHFPDWVDLLGGIIKEGKKDGAWFALPRDVADWWKKRAL